MIAHELNGVAIESIGLPFAVLEGRFSPECERMTDQVVNSGREFSIASISTRTAVRSSEIYFTVSTRYVLQMSIWCIWLRSQEATVLRFIW